MALAVVQNFSNTMQAHIAKGLLESHGIDAFILHEGFHSTTAFAFGSMPLYVDEKKLTEAAEILQIEIDALEENFTA